MVVRLSPLFFLSLVLVLCSSNPAWLGVMQEKKPLSWETLLIIKPVGNIKAAGWPDVRYQMTKADIAAVRTAFAEFTPAFVESLSGGRVIWKPTVVESTLPLMTVTRLGAGTWVSPKDVADDIRLHAPVGRYDNIFVYWNDSDDQSKKSLRGGFGWSIGPSVDSEQSGYSCVNFAPSERWTRDDETTEVFLHEWLHQLEAFYGERGVKLPRGGLHGNDNYGFKHQNGWKHWYRAFLQADLKEADGKRVGLGEQAWKLGTIRSETGYYSLDYLTPERRKRNLLRNGSFEMGNGLGWNPRSWRRDTSGVSVQRIIVKEGKQALSIRLSQSDDLFCYQNVLVKPNTRYLLSGWVKTEDVVVVDQANVGATLTVEAPRAVSRSLVGTKDWEYVTVVFNSADRQRIEVGARLGHNASLALGTAWFDDLCLIELPPLRSSAPAKHGSGK